MASGHQQGSLDPLETIQVLVGWDWGLGEKITEEALMESSKEENCCIVVSVVYAYCIWLKDLPEVSPPQTDMAVKQFYNILFRLQVFWF